MFLDGGLLYTHSAQLLLWTLPYHTPYELLQLLAHACSADKHHSPPRMARCNLQTALLPTRSTSEASAGC